jgi:alkylhydroperoxidase/carboxymuconolactone decarboxylase family protein YurZ
MSGDDVYELGLKTRREVLGDAEVESSMSAPDEFTQDFEHEITRREWGQVWSRPGLDRRTRICITVALLAAQGFEEELTVYVRAAIRSGVTTDEIIEIIQQTGLYVGAPTAHRALAVAREALLDRPSSEGK